ncbi:MAG: hypothetical protein ACOCXH_08480 [Cyclobacteriaceae bacterium]
MTPLSKYTLKGYFDEIKQEVNKQAGRVDANQQQHLLDMLARAAGIIEEVYETEPQLLHNDSINDYKEIVQTLKTHGLAAAGYSELLQEVKDEEPEQLIRKKPMLKATGRSRATSKKKKFGT